jgi:hypothetical protein
VGSVSPVSLKEWCDYCEGVREFDKSHFYTLFHNNFSLTELMAIFQYFPRATDLLSLMLKLRATNVDTWKGGKRFFPQCDEAVSTNELVRLAERDILEHRNVCVSAGDGELVNIIDNATVRFVEDEKIVNETRRGDIPYNWLFELVGDRLGRALISKERKIYALEEAFYGMCGDYYLCWYLSQPLRNFEINLNIYFDLWRKGGDYILTKDEILVTRRKL